MFTWMTPPPLEMVSAFSLNMNSSGSCSNLANQFIIFISISVQAGLAICELQRENKGTRADQVENVRERWRRVYRHIVEEDLRVDKHASTVTSVFRIRK